MKRIGVIVAVLFCCAGIVCAASGDLSARLAAPQARVRFDQCDLADALAITGETVHANVIADWNALQNVSVKQDQLISMSFDNISAAETFDVICRLVGGGATWYTDDNSIHVTTEAELNKQGETKSYWPNGIGGVPAERAGKAADLLRDYLPGLDPMAIRVSNGQAVVRGDADTQAQALRILELCSRPMTPAEWREMLGIEKDFNDNPALISVSWQSAPLAQCVQELAAKSKTPIVLEAAADPTLMVTLELKNATPRKVMNGLLGAIGAGQNSKADEWTCEPIAHGKILWVGTLSHADNFCASFLVGPMAMRDLHINSLDDVATAICSTLPGCNPGRVRWIGGHRVLCLQKLDFILAIGKLVGDPSFESAMRADHSEPNAAARNH